MKAGSICSRFERSFYEVEAERAAELAAGDPPAAARDHKRKPPTDRYHWASVVCGLRRRRRDSDYLVSLTNVPSGRRNSPPPCLRFRRSAALMAYILVADAPREPRIRAL